MTADKIKSTIRNILRENKVDLDDDILDYLIQIFNSDEEALPSEDQEAIISTYIPDIRDKQTIHALITALQQSNTINNDVAFTVCSMPPMTDTDTESPPKTIENDDVNMSNQHVNSKSDGDIDFLVSMMSLDRDLVEYVYSNICACSKTASVEYLLEKCSTDGGIISIIEKMKSAELLSQQLEEEEFQRQKTLKSSIFMKYGDQIVPPKYPDQKKQSCGPAPVLVVTTVGSGDRKIRFRDGQIVSRKGEKVIYEKDPWEDYDGGSRGKVKTKGKRGKGFV